MNNTQTLNDVNTISTEDLANRLKQNQNFEFWNVLTSEYYTNENIEGSRHVSLDQIGREAANKNLPKDTEIIVYCAGPHCPQSGMAVLKLQAYGFSNVRAYEGGLEEWKAAGLPVEREQRKASCCH